MKTGFLIHMVDKVLEADSDLEFIVDVVLDSLSLPVDALKKERRLALQNGKTR